MEKTTMSNYHTHTVYCDGNDTPEALVLEAIRLGCPSIGFSGHSFTEFDQSYCMSRERTEEYKREVRALKEKYRGHHVRRAGKRRSDRKSENLSERRQTYV